MKSRNFILSLLFISFVFEAKALCLGPKPGVQVATINYPGLKENSGIDLSNQHPGIIWAVNDEGKPAVFAIGVDGKNYGTFEIVGANKVDWEDVALARCFHSPEKDCIYIADTGNNLRERETLNVYVVEEPNDYKSDGKLQIVETISFKTNGKFNIEAMAVNETKQELYFISKNDKANVPQGVSSVFSLSKGKDMATLIATIDFNQVNIYLKERDKIITAADFDNDSQTLLLGTNDNALEIKLKDLPDFKEKVVKIKIPKMQQTEAMAYYWKADKLNILATSEGKTQPLFQVACE